jgi:hypothetical protein
MQSAYRLIQNLFFGFENGAHGTPIWLIRDKVGKAWGTPQEIEVESSLVMWNRVYWVAARTTVIDLSILTHRAGRFSCGATSLKGP